MLRGADCSARSNATWQFAVYNGFDQCLVLSMGRTAYCGPASDLRPFFESMGKPVTHGANPAEVAL